MKKIRFILISLFAVISLIGCSTNQNIISNTSPEFYPPGGMGDIVVMKTIENPFKLSVRYKNIKKVTVSVYEVDEKSFFDNAVGGLAAFEGYLDLSKFIEAKSLFEGEKEIFNDPNGKVEDELLSGYIELPITDFGYYYISFSYSGYTGEAGVDIGKFHTLLEVNSVPKEFNYSK